MKIVVVSDTHHNLEVLEKVALINSDADLFLHAGDSCLTQYEIPPYLSVKGNCDHFSFLDEIEIKTPYGKLVMMHGHKLLRVNEYTLHKYEAKIFIFGHTHRHKALKFENGYIFNPGSLVLPRDGTNGTYLVLNIDENDVKYEFKTL